MSASSKALPITVEQYEGFAGYPGLKDELIYGEIVMSPQPKPYHQLIVKRLQRLLDNIVEPYGYTTVQNSNIRFDLANSMPAPDILVLPANALLEACRADSYISTTPILVAEVISPANRKRNMEDKVRLYLDNGVALVVEIYPKRKMIRCYSPNAASAELYEEDDVTLPAAIAGKISISDIFTMEV